MRRLHMCRSLPMQMSEDGYAVAICVAQCTVRGCKYFLPIVVRWHILRVYRVQVGGFIIFFITYEFVYCATFV